MTSALLTLWAIAAFVMCGWLAVHGNECLAVAFFFFGGFVALCGVMAAAEKEKL